MAERRMFAKSIVLSDAFLDMPISAKYLYFTLGMFADDDGFVGNPKAVMRQCNATNDDMKNLLEKRYVLIFKSGVIVIKHWKMNNYIQSDRHKPTTYLEELSTLDVDEKGAYTEKDKQNALYTNCIQNVYTGKDSIDKDSIVKNNIDGCKATFTPPTLEEVEQYCIEHSYTEVIPQDFIDYYTKNGWTYMKSGKRTPITEWWRTLGQWNTRYVKKGEIELKKEARQAYINAEKRKQEYIKQKEQEKEDKKKKDEELEKKYFN